MSRARARLFALGLSSLLGVSGLAGCGGGGSDDGDASNPVNAGIPNDGRLPIDGGGPGPGDPDAGPVLPPPEGPLLITEIMYHPVLENDFVDRHEFVEIHNPTDEAVSLDGWAISGGVSFTFPENIELAASGYLVVARSREAFLAVYGEVDPALVHGDYQGELDNGGEAILLRLPAGGVSDAVQYDDDAPWPVAGDAMGASESWLPDELLPEELHQYRGYSLERVSVALAGADPANWVASVLDAPTPAKANSGAREVPHVIALSRSAVPLADDTRPIRAADEVRVRVRMSNAGAIDTAALDYFVDDVTRTNETIETVALRDDGQGGDENAGDRTYTAVVPAKGERSIVRYRANVTAGGEARQTSPRADDPYDWHAYYVSPAVDTNIRVYELFIDPVQWTAMFENIDNGRVSGCNVREEWNDKVPAVFVHDGRVYDVRVRYQGSRYNRVTGAVMETWPFPGPDAPDPLAVMSWRIQFPRYDRFLKRKVVIVNKLIDGCPGLTSGVGMQIFAEAGIPAPEVHYTRFYVNGGYYRYAVDIERPSDDMLDRVFKDLERRGLWPADLEIGHLFKGRGADREEGPYGQSDGRRLPAGPSGCNYSSLERYTYTYDRKTHEWLGGEPVRDLIEGLHAAKAQGPVALRTYLTANFDIDRVLTYLAIINWSVPYDDNYHNYYLYQGREDGKWMIFPWDLDRNFGDWKGERQLGPESSIFTGTLGHPDNANDYPGNHFKDTILRSFTAEYRMKLDDLNETVLHPDNLGPMVDAYFANASRAEAEAALSPVSCYFVDGGDNFKAFARDRHDHVADVVYSEQIP